MVLAPSIIIAVVTRCSDQGCHYYANLSTLFILFRCGGGDFLKSDREAQYYISLALPDSVLASIVKERCESATKQTLYINLKFWLNVD